MNWCRVGESNPCMLWLLRPSPSPCGNAANWRSVWELNPSHRGDSAAASPDASRTLAPMTGVEPAAACLGNRYPSSGSHRQKLTWARLRHQPDLSHLPSGTHSKKLRVKTTVLSLWHACRPDLGTRGEIRTHHTSASETETHPLDHASKLEPCIGIEPICATFVEWSPSHWTNRV